MMALHKSTCCNVSLVTKTYRDGSNIYLCCMCGKLDYPIKNVLTKEQNESTEYLKQRIRWARATGLLSGLKIVLQITNEIDKAKVEKLIDEVLELLE
jgi:hypothetical protein